MGSTIGNRRVGYWIAVLLLVLLLNTSYVAAFASPTVFYMTNVLGHVVLGGVLAIALLFILRRTGLLSGARIAVVLLLIALGTENHDLHSVPFVLLPDLEAAPAPTIL